MCDGNLAMANQFVDMSENDMNELHDWEVFKIFAKLHPHEAYELRPNDFCKFMRGQGFPLTDDEIKECINAITDADKALAILKAFHEIAHNSEKNEGLTITKDWDINTLTIETKEGHNHFGQMNCEDEKGFSILLNEIYRHYVR